MKKALKSLLIKASQDKEFRNKVKNKAYSSYKYAKNIKEQGEVMKTLGEKVGKLKKKIKEI